MSKKRYGKDIPDYPYSLSFNDIDLAPDERLTPEQVAMAESMHSQANYPKDDKNGRWASLRGNRNAHIDPEDRTPKQQEVWAKNLKYRSKYQEKRARIKLIELKKILKRTNPVTDPRLYAKILRNIKRNEDRIEELLIIKEKYGL